MFSSFLFGIIHREGFLTGLQGLLYDRDIMSDNVG